MFGLNKYSGGQSSTFNGKLSFKSMQLAVVVSVGKVPVSDKSNSRRKKDLRFNSDPHAIRCRIFGGDYDNKLTDDQLPNCYPMMPKHLNMVPKVGEVVMVVMLGEDEKLSDRYYMGPFISSLTKAEKDTFDTTATSVLMNSTTTPPEEIDRIPSANGVYEDPKYVIIDGRNNTDIMQRDEEILIRAGKFVTGQPLVFNDKNPGYIQIKHNFNIQRENGNGSDKKTVTNIVSEKINLITYADGSPEFDLTKVNDKTRSAEYIDDETLQEIMENAHPLVFGDTLVEYLKLFKSALINHVHNGQGNKPTDRTDGDGLPLDVFIKKAEELEKKMISKNIRIN
jgi:hypothetical protein